MERINAITPDKVWGSEFRVPQIIGEGSGKGFQVEGLHLPLGWKNTTQGKNIDPKHLQHYLEATCLEFSLEPGVVKFEPHSQVLEQISIRTEPVSYLKLDHGFLFERDGVYHADNVQDLQAAIVLQKVAGAWLTILWDELEPNLSRSFALIDGAPGRQYYSYNLIIPEQFLNPNTPLTNEYCQESFRLSASNIMGRFGLTLRTLNFDDRGLLRDYDLHEGNACGYYLEPDQLRDGQYYSHNVDTPYQAAALHGIGASFINHLLKQIRTKRN